MGASFRAESLKLRRRPAVWVLGLIWLVLTVIVGYAVVYVFLVNAPSPPVPEDIPEREREQIQQQERQFQEDQLRSLLPENLVSSTMPVFGNLGGAIALILGTLVVGGEYGWGTLKTIVTQRPNRPQVFGGKLLALWVVLVLFVIAVFVGSAAAGYVIAGLEGSPVGWPPAGELVRAFGSGVLILTLWAAFGALLATLFRSTALSVGLGLVYVLVLETLVLSLPIQNEAFQDAREFFPGQNSTFLANSFAEGPFSPPNPPVDPGQAALVVAAYAIVFVVVAALVFSRRDVV
ncbi:ABC transporter permease subunit [Rubrobacter tropicus]|uniref:ABC transporter permease subunit n=1 Tax=Rubrobacter tropicus TaxID=2653851 RepID=A0A6G8Q5P5_9ACTN|nr:ABC transporter permease subunit [Rubrobacter tropicus]QIN81647.1 ABC transporter permease subunit [Rubrobacter tropicus]